MTTFYVLPSRRLLGQRFAEMITAVFPSTQPTPFDWPDLAAALATLVEGQGSTVVVFREDLDDQLSVKDALLRDFGALLNDDVVEVQFGAGLLQVGHQCWSNDAARNAA